MADFFAIFDLTDLVLCCGIVLFASVLQTTIGMGFGMIASPLIALIRPELVPGSILIMGLLVAFFGAWQERENIAGIELRLGIWGRVVGSLVAFGILLLIPNISFFLILFGIIMLLAIALTVFGRKIAFTNNNLFGLSVVSGVMGTITAVGAPPMALIYHDRAPSIVRPTLNAFFFAGCVLGLVSLAASGWFRWDDLLAAILFIPAMLAGMAVGSKMKNISSPALSAILLSVSAVASIALIYKGFIQGV